MKPLTQKFTILIIFLLLCVPFFKGASQGFQSIVPLVPLPIDAGVGTADKTQSKVFFYDDKFWSVLANTTGTHLWRLDGLSWTNIRLLTTRKGRADVKVQGDLVHVFIFSANVSELVSLEYNDSDATFAPWTNRPTIINFQFNNQVQSATMDVDDSNRMWVAYVRNSNVLVQWSNSPYNNWSAPITLKAAVRADDGAVVIAMPGKVGVLWSDQITQRFGFKTHNVGDTPTSWSADEIPASQSALDVGFGMADDHMNVAVSNNGTLYCSVKTGYNNPDYPLIALLVRKPSGTWDDLYEVSNSGTKPIVILNELNNTIKVIYGSESYDSEIFYKESSSTTISFGPTQLLIGGSNSFRDPTSIKSNYQANVVILANNPSAGKAHGVFASDDGSPPPFGFPILSIPTMAATSIPLTAHLEWNSVFRADAYEVQVSLNPEFSNLVYNEAGIVETSVAVSGLVNGTRYYWRVRATNENEVSDWSEERYFTTIFQSGSSAELVAHWKMEEGGGNTLIDHSGFGNNGILRNADGVTWVPGVDGLSLNLPGTVDRYAEVNNAPSLNISDEISIAGWIRPTAILSKVILGKSTQNGYEVSITNNGKIEFWLNWTATDLTYRLLSTSNYIADGITWTHFAATFDGITMKIYLNGVEDSSISFPTPTAILNNNSILRIGAFGSEFRWAGGLDDLRIYHGTLSANAVATLYANEPDIPIAPILTAPSNNSTNLPISPDLQWNTVSGADFYQVQVGADQNFSAIVFDQAVAQGNTVNVPDLAYNATYYWRIRAVNNVGQSAWSTVWSFTIENEPISIPLAPLLDAPAENASNISIVPSLSWETVAGADGYLVQVATNNTFTDITFEQTGIVGPTVTTVELGYQTTYFWRVSAQNSAGQGEWSEIRSFTTKEPPVVIPATPELVYPSNNATGISIAPALSWLSVNGSESYQVQVATNDAFTDIVFQEAAISGTSVNASGLNFQTPYFWRVSAQNSAGQGPWSQVRTFTTENQPVVVPTAPTLSSPANNATGISITPSLSWQSVTGAESYQVQVATNDAFTDIVFQEAGNSGTSVNVSGLNFQTSYFWRVSAQNSAGESPWSLTRTFATENQPIVVPGTPSLSSPVNNATGISIAPALSWHSVTGAESYQVQVSTNDAFTDIVFQESAISGTSVNASGLNFQTPYFWRVSAQNSAGQGPWSQVRTFTTENQPVVVPAAPSLNSPENNASNISITPELSWQSVSGAESYQVQVSTNDAFTDIVFQEAAISGTSVNASGLNFQTPYFWRVSAQNSAGQGPWSQVRTFTTENQPVVVPAAPSLNSPENNASNISITPELSWQSVSGAESYQVQVSTNDAFTDIVFQEAAISGTSVNASGLNFQTPYFWRVSAQNSAGQGPWS
ncbi:LamG-like jellyroll fold domain-containing protein, partial [Lunatibacter salilacus]|uniref:LamG-like jellyroll fold domain-containing protein n=1 Tax=Lunatibacter salilacus TaxID=2483804 RepID=UPI00131ECA78